MKWMSCVIVTCLAGLASAQQPEGQPVPPRQPGVERATPPAERGMQRRRMPPAAGGQQGEQVNPQAPFRGAVPPGPGFRGWRQGQPAPQGPDGVNPAPGAAPEGPLPPRERVRRFLERRMQGAPEPGGPPAAEGPGPEQSEGAVPEARGPWARRRGLADPQAQGRAPGRPEADGRRPFLRRLMMRQALRRHLLQDRFAPQPMPGRFGPGAPRIGPGMGPGRFAWPQPQGGFMPQQGFAPRNGFVPQRMERAPGRQQVRGPWQQQRARQQPGTGWFGRDLPQRGPAGFQPGRGARQPQPGAGARRGAGRQAIAGRAMVRRIAQNPAARAMLMRAVQLRVRGAR
ncbi:MAG: hypothetical protein IPM29_09485 [Planctomycetes bacterium]|nr:hypothetical protein [Planctomycetota bacterium]